MNGVERGAYLSYQRVLERLGKLRELRDIVVVGRRRGFLERGEALRLVELLRDLVKDLSGGEASLTLRLIGAVEELIREPGLPVKRLALERFGRDDVVPMPEVLAEALPELPLIEILRASARGPLGRVMGRVLLERVARSLGLNVRVLEVLLSVRIRDLALELGYLFESLLHLADGYAKILESYVASRGVGELKLDSGTLSVFAEIVARAWLSMALRGPWAEAEPLPRYRAARYEFDAVSIERIEDRAEVHVAEVEVRCPKFLELEDRRSGGVTRIEGKIARLEQLLKTVENAYRPLGARRACIAEVVLICFDDPDPDLRDGVLSRARLALERLRPNERLCPSFTPEKSLSIYSATDMLQKLGASQPENRLRQAVEYIREYNRSTQRGPR